MPPGPDTSLNHDAPHPVTSPHDSITHLGGETDGTSNHTCSGHRSRPPGEGIGIEVFRLAGEGRERLKEVTTNDDGRCDVPILEGGDFAAGEYELVFHAGDYLRQQGIKASEPRFLDVIPLRFGVSDASAHYHVPLLLSPYGYSTYRGS